MVRQSRSLGEMVECCAANDENRTDANAQNHELVIFTQDSTSAQSLRLQNLERPSVVELRVQESMPEASGLPVTKARAATAEALREAALVTIDAYEHRIRMLPFPR